MKCEFCEEITEEDHLCDAQLHAIVDGMVADGLLEELVDPVTKEVRYKATAKGLVEAEKLILRS